MYDCSYFSYNMEFFLTSIIKITFIKYVIWGKQTTSLLKLYKYKTHFYDECFESNWVESSIIKVEWIVSDNSIMNKYISTSCNFNLMH